MSSQKYILFGLILLLISCKSTKIAKRISNTFDTSFYNNQFTGLLVFDPKTNEPIFSHNANNYFTPASNTKIFTLYTALKILPEKIPTFKYTTDNDTITIQGTGDPTFLHPFFQDSTALLMARKFKKVYVIQNNYSGDKFGPGWAWEDYDTYFSPERSSFPMYGNVITVNNQDSLQSIPKVLEKHINYSKTKRPRNMGVNRFYYNPENSKTVEIPMVIDSLLIASLWNAILPQKSNSNNEFDKKYGKNSI